MVYRLETDFDLDQKKELEDLLTDEFLPIFADPLYLTSVNLSVVPNEGDRGTLDIELTSEAYEAPCVSYALDAFLAGYYAGQEEGLR